MFDVKAHWLIPDWPVPKNVRAVTTTREGPETARQSPYALNLGTRCGDDSEAVARNRAFLRDALTLPLEPQWLRQVHGTRVVVAPFPDEPEADAAVTRTRCAVLAILTADCLPVLFCADDGSEIAAAHAGWRGLSAGVLENTLTLMHTPRDRVLAWLGPAIAAESYEVGDEVRAAFLAHAAAAASAFTATRPGHSFCDLYELARQRLRTAGVTRIFGGGFDTFVDSHLHSYRRDSTRSGRMASLIWLDIPQSHTAG